MTRSQQDVENLFASQGIPGRYRELARHPAPSVEKPQQPPPKTPPEQAPVANADAVAEASEPLGRSSLRISTALASDNPAPPRRSLARLGLVMPAPTGTDNASTGRPLSQLFARLSKGTDNGTPSTQSGPPLDSDPANGQPLCQLRLAALFAHLERNGKRR